MLSRHTWRWYSRTGRFDWTKHSNLHHFPQWTVWNVWWTFTTLVEETLNDNFAVEIWKQYLLDSQTPISFSKSSDAMYAISFSTDPLIFWGTSRTASKYTSQISNRSFSIIRNFFLSFGRRLNYCSARAEAVFSTYCIWFRVNNRSRQHTQKRIFDFVGWKTCSH